VRGSFPPELTWPDPLGNEFCMLGGVSAPRFGGGVVAPPGNGICPCVRRPPKKSTAIAAVVTRFCKRIDSVP
jgi:hypothetical protein